MHWLTHKLLKIINYIANSLNINPPWYLRQDSPVKTIAIAFSLARFSTISDKTKLMICPSSLVPVMFNWDWDGDMIRLIPHLGPNTDTYAYQMYYQNPGRVWKISCLVTNGTSRLYIIISIIILNNGNKYIGL